MLVLFSYGVDRGSGRRYKAPVTVSSASWRCMSLEELCPGGRLLAERPVGRRLPPAPRFGAAGAADRWARWVGPIFAELHPIGKYGRGGGRLAGD